MRTTDHQDPFLFSKATSRITGEDLPGRYCSIHQQWVIPHAGSEAPIVDIGEATTSMGTKTLTTTEKDDVSKQLLMVQTKTEAQLESEDKTTNMSGLMVQTKTKVHNESDDTQLSADVGWL